MSQATEGQATAPIQDNEKSIEVSSSDEIANILGDVSEADDGTPAEEGVESLQGILSDEEFKDVKDAVSDENDKSDDKETSKEDSHQEVDDDVAELLEDIKESEVDIDKDEDGPEEEDDGEIAASITYKGETVDFTEGEAKEMMQKGYDYTQKTMDLADERRDFEAEQGKMSQELSEAVGTLEKKYQGYDEALKDKETWDFALDNMKTEDPDLYEQVQDHYKDVHKFASNPLMDRQAQKINALEERLEKSLANSEHDSIRTQYNTEKSNLQTKLAPTLKKLNFTPNWDKIQQAYIDGAPTVEKAFHTAHGAEIFKLTNSKNKVNVTKNSLKNAKKVISPDNETRFKNLPKGKTLKDIKWNELVNHLAGSMG